MTFNAAVKLIDQQSTRYGSKEAIVDYVTGERITYAQLSELINRFGNALKELGISKGSRFVCMLPNVPEIAIAVLAGLKIGAVPVPCFSNCLHKELEYIVQNSDAELIITHEPSLPVAQAVKNNCPTLKGLMGIEEKQPVGVLSFWNLLNNASSTIIPEDTAEDDLALLCYTSGTTGKAKALPHSHANLIGQSSSYVDFAYTKFGPGDILYSPLPAGFSFGLCNLILYPFLYGACSLFCSKRAGPEEIVSIINSHQVSRVMISAAGLQTLIPVENAKLDPQRVKFHTGASTVTKAVFEAWEKRYPGVEVLQAFGMQELLGASHSCPPGGARPDTMGQLISGWSAMIIDENGIELQEGPGILYLRGPSMIKYYWKDPDLSEKRFLNGFLRTGDIVTRDKDGFFYYIGREDEMIKTAGWSVSPAEIEELLNLHPKVREAAVFGISDPDRGQIVGAAVVPSKASLSEELKEELQSYLRGKLSSYKVPRKFYFLQELPKTSTGKIKKTDLRQKFY